MNKNKTVHIISHTHWDREWYLPYEKHHVLLIELMDELLQTFDADEAFKSFHLDGHTIILDDYLQVRPEMREKVQHYIKEGRLQIGPWYILQDEFLTSSEANIRNLQYGMKDAEKWGGLAKVGYFPDSFGNVGQAPQILQQAGIKTAVFGRGVKPTGFNNTAEDTDIYESPYSEMKWEAPDGSTVLGVLFANWYCNGNEVPVNEEEATVYWNEKIAAMEKYAATPHLLMMNGCDHQPIQTDLPEAIQTAQKLYPDIDFKHSSFNTYIDQLGNSLIDDLKTVAGELRSQQTDGWGTLVNTASSRLYLKQRNRKGEILLEKVAEPLSTFAHMLGAEYKHHLFEYSWKTLMQNHPHDSICGCSVDEVHRAMITRFEESQHVAEMIVDENLAFISNKVNTSSFENMDENALPFIVFNTTGMNRTGVVTVTLDVKREYFSSGVNKKELKNFALGQRAIIDSDGATFACDVKDLGIHFGYDLPKDKFRQPYMARRIQLTFHAEDVPALGFKTYACVLEEENIQHDINTLVTDTNVMENEFLHVKIEGNGSLVIYDKVSGKAYNNLCVYEDTGDIGNEYMYKQPDNETPLTTENLTAEINLVENNPYRAIYEIIHKWELPVSATELLEVEQREMVDFKYRKSVRSSEKIPYTIKTFVSLEKNSKDVDVKTTFINNAEDHRLRVLFPTDIQTDQHQADSIFEVVTRNNEPEEGWTNPDHSQHNQAFVDLSDEESGLTIANYGLYEYEVLRDKRQTIALTLVRSVGELGDWGYFPTPEAQCLGEHTVSFKIIPHQGGESKLDAYHTSYQYQVPWSTKQIGLQQGELPPVYSFIQQESKLNRLVFSSLKVSEKTNDILARWFNMTDVEDEIMINLHDKEREVYKSNIIEEDNGTLKKTETGSYEVKTKKHEIVTIGIKE
ncbi:alpha-mannosidase [Virgibacillus halodenitrificans]|uniref:alpha-mannosidase n=1 Tax=Virgibacillus halodenitrificans TaxID=1482 RepID=UPI00136E9ECB|nr:alpha-mannosidase [Virgibacillus halodenitrificans]MYL45256.1 alpha-mannosidase [Virgibacillus halodenitrificans]